MRKPKIANHHYEATDWCYYCKIYYSVKDLTYHIFTDLGILDRNGNYEVASHMSFCDVPKRPVCKDCKEGE